MVESEQPDGAPWTAALPLVELWEGEMIALRVHDVDVLLVNLGRGEIYAYDNRCPHAGAPLHAGRLRAAVLQCELHQWEFDVRTGLGINPRRCQLQRYPVAIADGQILVRIERSSPGARGARGPIP
ncbi:MAG TPA: Rieske 2Fe-2S domain-containing protein [Polyangiaceae bacterium]|nr:Rieske 2Fe-2S domain-containing protein [Polyangiaceae bacterium]